MISKVTPLFAKMRSMFLFVIALCLVGFLGATDFMFRHEIKRQAKKQLIADGLQPTVQGIIEATKQKRFDLLVKYDTAGIDFGGIDETGMTPLNHAIIDNNTEAIDEILLRSKDVARTINKIDRNEGLNPLMRSLNRRDFNLANRLIDEVNADVNTEKTPGLPYLISALNTDDREMFDFLIKKGVDPNIQGSQPHAALPIAADKDNLELMQILVDNGASIETPGVSGNYLLIESAQEREYDEMEYLLSKGADVNYANDDIDVLSIALDTKDSRMKNLAVDNGVNLNRNGKSGMPIVVEAFEEREYPWLQTMLSAGQPVESKTASGDTFFASAVNSADYKMVDFLIGNGASVNAKGKTTGLSPLEIAVAEGDTALVRTLVENRAKIDHEGMFATAYRNRDNPTMNLLLNAGADPEIKLKGTNQRLIDVAVNEGAVDTVRILLDNGADLGDNLWGALLTGQDELVEVILKNGCDPEQKSTTGETPLEYALNNERFNLLKPLLAAGASPNPMYDQDESWLSRSIRTNNRDAAYGLIMAGADVSNERASDGHSLLGWSIGNNMFDVTKLLLQKGLDPNIKEPSPATDAFTATFDTSRTFRRALKYDSKIHPLMMAAVKKNHDVAKALVDAGAKNATSRKYLYPVAIAAWYSDVRMMQICYGRNPDYQPRKLVVNLSSQRVTLYENGSPTFSSVISSGKPGYETKTGKFVITQKKYNHTSTIYGSQMPRFMRVSCSDFGLHQGIIPGRPASAGCVRLPWHAADHLYYKCKIGDLVVIHY